MDKLQQLQKLYRAQTAKTFLQTNPNLDVYPVMNPKASAGFTDMEMGLYLAGEKDFAQKAPHGDWLASAGDFQNEYITGGFFADCELEASIVNTTVQPIHSLWNLLPIRGSVADQAKYGFLTGISDPSGPLPTTKCEPGQTVGDMAFCSAAYNFGRYIYSSHTLEMDELIRLAKQASWEQFYLLGSVRGVSAIPSAAQMTDRDAIGRAHVRREMMLIGRAHQRQLLQKLWTADPDGGGQTGAVYDFLGLDKLISEDWDTFNFVTGDACDTLNSDVKVFDDCIGGTSSIYNIMRELEDTIYQRALLGGHLPVQWVWVMSPTHWAELARYLPCELISESCNSQAASNVSITVNDMSAAQMRNQLLSTMRIDMNGRSYPVVLDHGIPLTLDTEGPSYNGNIYFVPLRAAGENVLEIWHRDYSQLAPQFAGVPFARHYQDAVYSDGGRFLWGADLSQTSYCFGMTAKVEPALIFRAPHLAGKITDVYACPLQEKPIPTF